MHEALIELENSKEQLSIALNKDKELNELIMYAENLGSIPPNTALMVIYDGKKRIELNIKSTEKTNGAVSFKFRE